eukprot:1816740-Rhodomonas_salina.1
MCIRDRCCYAPSSRTLCNARARYARRYHHTSMLRTPAACYAHQQHAPQQSQATAVKSFKSFDPRHHAAHLAQSSGWRSGLNTFRPCLHSCSASRRFSPRSPSVRAR